MNDKRAKQYTRQKYYLFFIDLIFTALFLIAYQFMFSSYFKNFSHSFSHNAYIIIVIYISIFCLINYFLSFPLDFYRSYILEHKFLLSNQRFFEWLKDEFKRAIISFIVFLILIHGFYIILRNSGSLWWLWSSLAYLGFNLLFARILPTFILPLFYKYSRIYDENLKKNIYDLAKRSSIKLIDIFQIDFSKKTKKANAALIGLGKSRRVILADNLIKEFNQEETLAVLAHEFAHHKMFHLWKIIMFSGVTGLAGFYLLSLARNKVVEINNADGLYDIVLLPSILFLLFVFSISIKPIQSAYSRLLESQADKFTLDITNAPGVFISLMKKLSRLNLSDENPPTFIKYMLYDHPPISERIEMAENYKKSQ